MVECLPDITFFSDPFKNHSTEVIQYICNEGKFAWIKGKGVSFKQ